MSESPAKTFAVGIDPGTQTGLGIYALKSRQILNWSTHDFFTVQEFLPKVFPNKDEVKVYIELPPKFVYARRSDLAGGARDTHMGDAGGNRREAQLLGEALRRQGWDVELVAPVREKKWDAEKFRLFTGKAGSSNAHERDAVRLAVYYAKRRQLDELR